MLYTNYTLKKEKKNKKQTRSTAVTYCWTLYEVSEFFFFLAMQAQLVES